MINIPRIGNVEIARLVEPPTNPNHMEDSQFELLVEAMRRAGFLQPLLVREPLPGELSPADETVARLGGLPFYRIVDGVHRFRAAKLLGMIEVPCVILPADVSDETISALQVGMNRLRGELNLAEVAKTLALLASKDWSTVDLTLTGMSEDEITDLLRANRPTTADDVLADAALGAEPTPDPAPEDQGTFTLEIVFTSSKEHAKARRALKKAAGKGYGLDVGLMRIIAGEAE